jgi:uncharacterized membrane protein YhaH (DUF805 family)
MQPLSNEALRGRWRRRLFWAWVVAAVAVAAYLAVGGSIATYVGAGKPPVALALPALMIFMLSTGIAWLVLLVASKRQKS